MRISIVIPTFNESACIESTLECLEPLRQQGHEVLVVDGGSTDETRELVNNRVDRVIQTTPGRAHQMNVGASHATGDILWFIHADTKVFENAAQLILKSLANDYRHWGRFDIRLSGEHFLLRVVERLMNLRSSITGIATGDQGIFVRRNTFSAIGGFMLIPLMEDVEISRRLKKWAHPCCLRDKLITSSRRWEENGVLRTVLLMWRLRLAYALGVSPEKLAHAYKLSD